LSGLKYAAQRQIQRPPGRGESMRRVEWNVHLLVALLALLVSASASLLVDSHGTAGEEKRRGKGEK